MADPPFAVTGIDHIVLRVRALPSALGFYRDVLGCSVERQQPELGLTQLRAGRSLIDLVTLDGPLGRAPEPATPGPATQRRSFLPGRSRPFREGDLCARWLAASRR